MSIQAAPNQVGQIVSKLSWYGVDASHVLQPRVQRAWHLAQSSLEILIEDQEHGISNPANLFVPFFTTKPGAPGLASS